MSPLTRRAVLRMLCLVPVDLPAPGTVADADLRTSMCDARAAVTIACGWRPDIDGYPMREAQPARQLDLFEVAA